MCGGRGTRRGGHSLRHPCSQAGSGVPARGAFLSPGLWVFRARAAVIRARPCSAVSGSVSPAPMLPPRRHVTASEGHRNESTATPLSGSRPSHHGPGHTLGTAPTAGGRRRRPRRPPRPRHVLQHNRAIGVVPLRGQRGVQTPEPLPARVPTAGPRDRASTEGTLPEQSPSWLGWDRPRVSSGRCWEAARGSGPCLTWCQSLR